MLPQQTQRSGTCLPWEAFNQRPTSRGAWLAHSPSSLELCTLPIRIYLLLAQGFAPPDVHSCLRNYLLIPCQDVFFADGSLKRGQPKRERERPLKMREQRCEWG